MRTAGSSCLLLYSLKLTPPVSLEKVKETDWAFLGIIIKEYKRSNKMWLGPAAGPEQVNAHCDHPSSHEPSHGKRFWGSIGGVSPCFQMQLGL